MARSRMRRAFLRLGGLAVAVLVLLAGLFFLFQRRLIYIPNTERPSTEGVAFPVSEVSFTTEDGLTLGAWFVPSEGPPRGTILVFHGVGGNRAGLSSLAAAFRTGGYSVLLTDYRGYGGNPGSPSSSGLTLDAEAALRYLDGRADVDPAEIAYFGESLGASVATRLASEHPPAALILRSPSTSLADAIHVRDPFVPTFLIRDTYPVADLMPGIQAPVLVVAGTADRRIPEAMSRRVFDAANEPKRFVEIPGADHGDLSLVEGPPLTSAVIEFLTQTVGTQPALLRARRESNPQPSGP